MAGEGRYWVAVCYPENMLEHWQDKIDDILELPFCYCIHDKDHLADYKPNVHDSDEDKQGFDDETGKRKTHVHIIIAFNNSTTYKNAYNTFMKLSADGKKCLAFCQKVISIKAKYDYLIHGRPKDKTQGKYQYDPSERIEGNNFDIGAYMQVSEGEKRKIRRKIAGYILENQFTNYYDLYCYVISTCEDDYEDVLCSYNGFFSNLCKGVYLKKWENIKENEQSETA